MTTGTHNDGGDEEQHPEGTEIPEGISEEMSADDYLVAKKKKKPISTRPKSATVEHPEEGHLPTAVNTQEQLVNVPAMYLSDNPKRPLLLTVEGEGERPPYTYALNPLTYSVLAILAIEGLERFAYYGTSSRKIYTYLHIHIHIVTYFCLWCFQEVVLSRHNLSRKRTSARTQLSFLRRFSFRLCLFNRD